MKIIWNGKEQETTDGIPVAEFLTACGLEAESVIIELNGEIYSAGEITRPLEPGDKLNAFRIVAGG